MAIDGTGNGRRLTNHVPVRRPPEPERPPAPKPAEPKPPAARNDHSSFTPQNAKSGPSLSESSSLLTENSRDGKANCLDVAADWVEKATPDLRSRADMVFLKDSRPGAEGQSGHVMIRQGNSIVDPSTGKNYANLQAYLKEQPHYQPAGILSANAAAKIFAAPPGSAERQKAITDAKVPDSLQRMMVADAPQAAPQTQTTPQAPSYTQSQADRDAAALYDAMEGGVTGWGTDEDTIFKTLEGKSPEQIDLIRKGYKDHYGKDLDSVIRDELSGADEKHAVALLQGDAAKSAAVQVQAELDGVFIRADARGLVAEAEGDETGEGIALDGLRGHAVRHDLGDAERHEAAQGHARRQQGALLDHLAFGRPLLEREHVGGAPAELVAQLARGARHAFDVHADAPAADGVAPRRRLLGHVRHELAQAVLDQGRASRPARS